MSTAAQICANQENARLSTGPRSDIGKAISSKNALATGLTGRTVLLPTDDKARYEAHLASYRDLFRPANALELNLVQAIADSDWRLTRIPILISGIEARAEAEIDVERAIVENADGPSPLNDFDAGIEGYLRYERQIANLYTQEGRLYRRREKDFAQLKLIQSSRNQQESMRLRAAAKSYREAVAAQKPFDLVRFGFEFTLEQIQAEAERLQPRPTPRALDVLRGPDPYAD